METVISADAACEPAPYEARAAEALEKGSADINAGRYVVGIDAAKEAVARMREKRGGDGREYDLLSAARRVAAVEAGTAQA